MKFNLWIFALVCVLLLGKQVYCEEESSQQQGPPFSYENQSGNAGFLVDTSVPQAYNDNLKEIGYSFWIKGSFTTPGSIDWDRLKTNGLHIAHITDNQAGSCNDSELGHRFLTLYLAPSNTESEPAFQFSSYNNKSGNNNKFIQFPDKREDFDNTWNFVSFSYSFVEQKAVAFVKFGKSQQILSQIWENNDKLDTKQLKFRIGGCNANNRDSFNGKYFDVNFQYSNLANSGVFISTQDQFENYMGSRFYPNENVQEQKVVNLIDSTGITRLQSDNSLKQWNFEKLHGVKEYAIWGWIKWSETNQQKNYHSVYRLSGLKQGDVQNDSKIGDRTLSCMISNDSIEFSTYNFDWHEKQNKNDNKKVEYKNDLEKWIFIYQGYSYTEKRAIAYVNFQNRSVTKNWENIWHMRPDDITLYLGKDPFYTGFNGQMKGWNVGIGQGSYREGGFDQLMHDELILNKDFSLVEPSEPAPTIITANGESETPVYQYTVPADEISKIKDTSYSFWFRWNYFSPSEVDIQQANGNQISVAELTENNELPWQTVLYRKLSEGNPALKFQAYAGNNRNKNNEKTIEFGSVSEFDQSWNFLYFGYSYDTQRLFSYVKLGATGQVQTLAWEPSYHNQLPSALHFRLGGKGSNNYGFNGHFWNVRFYYLGQNYLGSQAAVQAYFESSKKPQQFLSVKKAAVTTLVEESKTFLGDEENIFGPIQAIDGAHSYAIYGWAKWYEMQNEKSRLTTLFKSSNIDYRNSPQSEEQKIGDNFMSCYIDKNGYLSFRAYSSQQNSVKDLKFDVEVLEELKEEFFFYMGYNFEKKRSFIYVQLGIDEEKRVVTGVIENVFQQIPTQPFLYLGSETGQSAQFKGEMKKIYLSYGPGSYRETNIQGLIGDIDVNSEEYLQETLNNQQQQQSVEVTSNGSALLQKQEWQEFSVPKEDLKKGINSYSISGYVKFSLAEPERCSKNIAASQARGIFGVTTGNDFCSSDKAGDRTLAVYDWNWSRAGVPSYNFATYDLATKNNNVNRDIVFAEDSDVEGSWNWVYFAYSAEAQEAIAYVKFGQSGIVSHQVFREIQHQDSFKSLKFIYGNCGSTSNYNFHGNFYDMRFRYDTLAYKESVGAITNYWQNYIPRPPTSAIPYTKVALTTGQKKYTQSGPGQQEVFTEQFKNAKQYAVYGWAKWTDIAGKNIDRNTWHTLFRLTTNEDSVAANKSNLGDRTLGVWVGQGILHFSTYTFSRDGAQNTNLYQNIVYEDDLDSWFFVYFGYNYENRTAFGYVKFQNRVQSVQFENTNHFVAKQLRVDIGKDRWNQGFSGYMSDWKFAVGEGAYRETDFEELYTKHYWEEDQIQAEITPKVIESSISDIIEEKQQTKVIEYENDPAAIDIYGFFGWTRWSFRNPGNFGHISQWAGQCYSISSAVYAKGLGMMVSLCVSQENEVYYKFKDTLNDLNTKILIDDPSKVLDKWVWFYYGHNQTQEQNTLYIYFNSDQSARFDVQDEATKQAIGAQKLQYKLGGKQEGQKVWNGYFYNCKFQTGKDIWIEDEAQFEGFRASQGGSQPANYLVNKALTNVQYYKLKYFNTFEVNQNSKPINSSRFINDYQDISEYSVFGWTKVNENNQISQNEWTFFFRLTINQPEILGNVSSLGDRTLCIWFHKSLKMYAVTYNYEYPSESNINYFNTIDGNRKFTQEQLTSAYFFTYMGYSQKSKQYYVYMHFEDGNQISFPVSGVEHISTSYLGFYLGIDFDGTNTYPALDASFKGWNIAVGKGSFSNNLETMSKFILVSENESQAYSGDNEQQEQGVALEKETGIDTQGFNSNQAIDQIIAEVQINNNNTNDGSIRTISSRTTFLQPTEPIDNYHYVPRQQKREESQREQKQQLNIVRNGSSETHQEEEQIQQQEQQQQPVENIQNEQLQQQAPVENIQNEQQQQQQQMPVENIQNEQEQQQQDNTVVPENNSQLVASNSQITQQQEEEEEGQQEEQQEQQEQQQIEIPEQADCVILYSQCGFQGEFEEICNRNPSVYIDVRSIYVPDGLRIKLYNLPRFEGQTAIFHETVECLENIDFNMLQLHGIKLIKRKTSGLSFNIKKKKTQFIQAEIMLKDEKEDEELVRNQGP